jgi:hypothetical protein
MRGFHATSRGVTLAELAVCVAASSIALLIGLTTIEMGWRGVRDIQYANVAYQNAFGAMNSIEEQIEQCNTIQIPDPDNASVNSIQVLVPNQANPGTTLRRAYRLVGNNLLMQRKDEGNNTLTMFSNVTSFTATMLDAPTNSLVQLNCKCAAGNEAISISTVAWRRN